MVVVLLLVRDGAGSKWSPVHKVYKQLPEKQSRGVQRAHKLQPFAILILNLTLFALLTFIKFNIKFPLCVLEVIHVDVDMLNTYNIQVSLCTKSILY